MPCTFRKLIFVASLRPPIKSNEQIVVVILLTLGLAGIGLYFWNLYRNQADVIEIDEATRFENPFTVDLNSGSVEELAVLPGIGPKLAQTIVDFRNANGRFTAPEDLLKVPGIGPAKLAAIRGYLAPLEPTVGKSAQ